MDSQESYVQILPVAGANLRHNFLPHALLALGTALIAPLLFGMAHLDSSGSALPLEMYLSLTGIILLTPVFQPEQDRSLHELVSSKWIARSLVYLIRTVYSFLALAVLVGLAALVMRLNDCDVTLSLYSGTLATAVFLGALGMLASAISGNTAVAYMVPLVYYMMNLGGGSRLGAFYLFGMLSGDEKGKSVLWFSGAAMVLLSLFIEGKLKRSGSE